MLRSLTTLSSALAALALPALLVLPSCQTSPQMEQFMSMAQEAAAAAAMGSQGDSSPASETTTIDDTTSTYSWMFSDEYRELAEQRQELLRRYAKLESGLTEKQKAELEQERRHMAESNTQQLQQKWRQAYQAEVASGNLFEQTRIQDMTQAKRQELHQRLRLEQQRNQARARYMIKPLHAKARLQHQQGSPQQNFPRSRNATEGMERTRKELARLEEENRRRHQQDPPMEELKAILRQIRDIEQKMNRLARQATP